MLNTTRPRCSTILCPLALAFAAGAATAQGATSVDGAPPPSGTPSTPAPDSPPARDAAAPSLASPTRLPRRFGERGDTRFNVLVGAASDFDRTELVQGGVGVSWFVVDSLSLDLELMGVGVFQDEDAAGNGGDAGGATLSVLARWHFWENESRTISLYAEAGVGVAGFSEDVPAGGSEFNFTPQVGIGASFEIAQNTRLMTGVRWLHVSNAQLYSGNPGLDTALLYAGVSIGF